MEGTTTSSSSSSGGAGATSTSPPSGATGTGGAARHVIGSARSFDRHHLDRMTRAPLTRAELASMYLTGTFVGVANAAVFHPMDVLRIRYFFHSRKLGTEVSMDQLGSKRSFWNGVMFNIWSTAIKQMAFYPTQEVIKRLLEEDGYSPAESQFMSAVGVGVILGLIASPINVIKVPLQAGTGKDLTVGRVCRDVYRHYGLAGFFRGGLAVVTRDTVWSVTYFPLYFYLRKHVAAFFDRSTTSASSTSSSPSTSSAPLTSRSHDMLINSVTSVTASIAAMVASYPFDCARLYRQKHLENHSFWHGFAKSFHLGSANLKSFTTAMLRVPLANVFSHTLYLFIQHKNQ